MPGLSAGCNEFIFPAPLESHFSRCENVLSENELSALGVRKPHLQSTSTSTSTSSSSSLPPCQPSSSVSSLSLFVSPVCAGLKDDVVVRFEDDAPDIVKNSTVLSQSVSEPSPGPRSQMVMDSAQSVLHDDELSSRKEEPHLTAGPVRTIPPASGPSAVQAGVENVSYIEA